MKRALLVAFSILTTGGLLAACGALGGSTPTAALGLPPSGGPTSPPFGPTSTLQVLFLTATPVSGEVAPAPTQAGVVQATISPNADLTNGEQIYFTGSDKNGNRIAYTGGPNFGGMMMGGFLTCAACHGPAAAGGQHFMHMQVMDAPPIYYSALTQMKVNDSGGTETPEGYTLANFRQEVMDGKDVDGDPLDVNMPRWQMSDKDLADLFAFLKTITP